MLRLAEEAVLSVGDNVYRWEDVRLAAEHRGEWMALVTRARASLARLRRSEEDGSPVAASDLDRAAEEFRYARDLETAEEMEAWLSRWRLGADEWMAALHARLLEDAWPDVPPDEDDDLLHAELVTRGDAERLARRLAERAAVAAAAGASADLASLDAAFAAFRARVVTPDAVAEHLRERRAEWTLVDGRLVRYPREEMAREAALATREDGESLDDVSAVSRTRVEELHAFAEELDDAVRDRVLGAASGEMLGPLRWGESFALVLVESKTPPSPDDPAVVARAEESLLSRALDRLVSDRVEWLFK